MFLEHHVMDEWFGFGRPTSKRAGFWLLATLALGLLFLVGQWVAWTQLASAHVYFRSNPSSHFFYLITFTHAAHLFLGTILLKQGNDPSGAVAQFAAFLQEQPPADTLQNAAPFIRQAYAAAGQPVPAGVPTG